MAEAMGMGMVTQKRIVFRSLFLKFLGIPTFKRKRERRTVKENEMEWQRVGRKEEGAITEDKEGEFYPGIYRQQHYVLPEFVN